MKTLPLVQQTDLVYQGSFRVPPKSSGDTDAMSLAYGGTALAFNPARNSLYIVGYEPLTNELAAEITIPATLGTGAISTMPVASYLQRPADVTEGRMPLVNPGDVNGSRIGGLLPWNGKLIISAYAYYDGSQKALLSHFVSGLPLAATGDIQGPFQVGTLPVKITDTLYTVGLRAGYAGGYMGPIPQAWQATLGGPAFTGQCCLAIVGRTSQGPAFSVFDPADVGVKNPVPATPLVYYDTWHSLGAYNSANPFYNGTAKIGGAVFPEGTRSVLFFGRIGTTFCYGAGTTNLSLNGQPVPNEPGVIYCYDLEDQSKGTHGYPYRYQVWAYDANDFVLSKAGTIKPWEVKPYAIWSLTLPTPSTFTRIMGVAYDPASGRIFLSQFKGNGNLPLQHVYKLALSAIPPQTPTNLTIKE